MPFFSVVLETCDDGCLSPFPHWGPRMLQFWFYLSLFIRTELSVQRSSLHCRCVDTLATLYRWTAGTLFLVFSYCFSKDVVSSHGQTCAQGPLLLFLCLSAIMNLWILTCTPSFLSSVSCLTSSTLQWSQFWFTVILWVSSDTPFTGLQFIA